MTGLYVDYLNSYGLKYLEDLSIERSQAVYDFIDNSKGYYISKVHPKFRSRMNVVVHLSKGEKVTEKFLVEAEAQGLIGLQGFKHIGGIRISLYNGMLIEGVKALIEFMKKFMDENK